MTLSTVFIKVVKTTFTTFTFRIHRTYSLYAVISNLYDRGWITVSGLFFIACIHDHMS